VLAGALWDRVGSGWAFGAGAGTAAVALGIVVASPSLRAAARAESALRAGWSSAPSPSSRARTEASTSR